MIIAQQNGRKIGAPDKMFGISSKAKERIAEKGRENVINSTIGVLLDDDGNLVVLDSVMEAIRNLSPEDYAAYAPIIGTPEYNEAAKKAVFMQGIPDGCFVESCYTPGGTGAIRNSISAYTKPGDLVMTSDWMWAPYNLIAEEIGRKIETYELFDDAHRFNAESFEKTLTAILDRQDETLVIINTPGHNPTGYTFTDEDWDKIIAITEKFDSSKKIILLVDIAYIDFAGDPVKYRSFLPKLTGLPENILPLIAFSASKGYTMYGMRCGAVLCMAPSAEIAKEFVDVMSVESRASWSNGNRAAMTAIADIIGNEELFDRVKKERADFTEVLNHRGKIFSEEAARVGLTILPYDCGFFVTVPCPDAEAAGLELQKHDIFAIPLGKGIRISVASNNDEECRKMPAILKKVIDAQK